MNYKKLINDCGWDRMFIGISSILIYFIYFNIIGINIFHLF